MERIAPEQHAAAASTPSKEKEVQAAAARVSDAENFAAALAPLVTQAGIPLSGPGLALCVRAFGENPEGFKRVVDHLRVRRGVRSPLGLLIRMIRDGDHHLPAPPPPSHEVAAENGNGARPARSEPCPSCGLGGGLHIDSCELAG